MEHPCKILSERTKVRNVVTIPSNGEAFFIRNGKNLVKLLREEEKLPRPHLSFPVNSYRFTSCETVGVLHADLGEKSFK